MQETVQVKIKSSNLVEMLWKYQFSKSGHLEVSRFAFGGWGSRNRQYLIKYFKYCKKILDFSMQYILQHMVKIPANSVMVELESLLKLVELSWNDPKGSQ